MQKSMMLFTFFVFDQKYPFCANLDQKIKIMSLSWNLIPTITHKIFETNCCFHVKWRASGKSLISVFQEFSTSINKTFILAGSPGTRLSFDGV